jgi:hypothetical protein
MVIHTREHQNCMMRSFHFRVRTCVPALLVASVLLARCGGGSTPSNPTPTPTLTAVTVANPSGPALTGQTAQLTATASFSDGMTQSITSQATWTSSSDALATVSPSGMVTFVAPGEVDIRATYRTLTGAAHITVATVVVRYAVSGVVTDKDNGRGLQGARVEILDGPDAGRSAQTDANGAYRLADVVAGRIMVRVSNQSYDPVEQPITLSSDTRLDVALKIRLDITPLYGTFNVSLSVIRQTCEFPITPGTTGQVTLSGGADGRNVDMKIVERGTTRTYKGSMQTDGKFSGGGGGVIAGIVARLGPIIWKHDYTGGIEGRVTGRSISGTESILYGAPCPGKILDIGFSGSK